MGARPLPRIFYARDTLEVAKDLLGKVLVRSAGDRKLAGRIVEVEAYKGLSDPASHAYRGENGRARLMFGEVGRCYVYFVYGNHYCVNVVAKSSRARAGAVLLRALEPLQGVDVMRCNRGTEDKFRLTSGPGRLTKAMEIDLKLYGTDLTKLGSLYIGDGGLRPEEVIVTAARVGVTRAAQRPWRFLIAGSEYVSVSPGQDAASKTQLPLKAGLPQAKSRRYRQ